MKTKHFIFVLIAVAVLFTTCKKDDDCCAKYIGDWDFVTVVSIIENSTFIVKDTIYYSGTIIRGNDKNHLIIQFTENNVITVHVISGNLWLAIGGEVNPHYMTCHKCTVGSFINKNEISILRLYKFIGSGEKEVYHSNGVKRKGVKNE